MSQIKEELLNRCVELYGLKTEIHYSGRQKKYKYYATCTGWSFLHTTAAVRLTRVYSYENEP